MNALADDPTSDQPAAPFGGYKPSHLPDAVIPIVPLRPDGSRDWQRQGWRAVAVTRHRCIIFKRRLKTTELVGIWLQSADPVARLLQRGVPPTVDILNRLIWMIGRLDIPDDYQGEFRSLMGPKEERPLHVTEADYQPTMAGAKVVALNRASGLLHNRLRRLHQLVEPLAATDRLHLRPVVLAMNLVIDHVELLMEMHAGLSGSGSQRSSTVAETD